jgi:hypothetical protein
MPRPLSLAVLATCLFAAPAVAQQQPERKSITVVLSVSKSEAFGRVMAAFVEEGLVVTESSEGGGVVTVGPFVPNKYSMGVDAEVTYRANVIASDSTSRVILSGTIRPSRSSSTPSALTSRWKGAGSKAWALLEKIAGALGGTLAESAGS